MEITTRVRCMKTFRICLLSQSNTKSLITSVMCFCLLQNSTTTNQKKTTARVEKTKHSFQSAIQPLKHLHSTIGPFWNLSFKRKRLFQLFTVNIVNKTPIFTSSQNETNTIRIIIGYIFNPI